MATKKLNKPRKLTLLPEEQTTSETTEPEDNMYRTAFQYALSEAFKIELEAMRVAESIKIQLNQQGDDATFERAPFFEGTVRKLSEIFLVHHLILALGLADKRDEILSHVIAERFQRVPKFAGTPNKTVETDKEQHDLLETLREKVNSMEFPPVAGK